jgi:hypothetical protein
VDEVMRSVQGTSEETQIERFHALSVRVGVAGSLKSVASPCVMEEQTT